VRISNVRATPSISCVLLHTGASSFAHVSLSLDRVDGEAPEDVLLLLLEFEALSELLEEVRMNVC
jgi:hypothetical protein